MMTWLILNSLHLVGSGGPQCTLGKLLLSQNFIQWCHNGLGIVLKFRQKKKKKNVSELKGKKSFEKKEYKMVKERKRKEFFLRISTS